MNLGTGEALTSFLDEKGVPQIVQDTAIICPQSRMAPCEEEVRAQIMSRSPISTKYYPEVDNDSAYEVAETARSYLNPDRFAEYCPRWACWIFSIFFSLPSFFIKHMKCWRIRAPLLSFGALFSCC